MINLISGIIRTVAEVVKPKTQEQSNPPQTEYTHTSGQIDAYNSPQDRAQMSAAIEEANNDTQPQGKKSFWGYLADGAKAVGNFVKDKAQAVVDFFIGGANPTQTPTTPTTPQIAPKTNKVPLIQALGEETSEFSQSILDKLTNSEGQNLDAGQQTKLLAVSFLQKELDSTKASLEAQDNEEGVIRQGFNWVKELTGLGVSKEDVQEAIEKQEQMINELTSAIEGKSDDSFEDVWLRWTGVEYDPDKILEYQQNATEMSLYQLGITKALAFESAIQSADTMGQAYDLYVAYYGDKETARQEFNLMLQEGFENAMDSSAFNNQTNPYINEDGEFIVDVTDDLYGFNPNRQYTTENHGNIYDIGNPIKMYPAAFNLTKYSEEFNENFEQILGKSPEQLQQDYAQSQKEAIGTGNQIQNLLNEYCQSQNDFIDKVSQIATIGGIGLMVIGGVTVIVCPPAGAAAESTGYAMAFGMGAMTVGQYMAVGGMFSDNVMELVDNLTSENGLTKDEAIGLVKETLTELALLYSGAQINKVSGAVHQIVLTKTQSQVLAYLGEIGVDASLSLLSDLIITGDVDLKGEGISQLLAVISGIAGAKVKAYKADVSNNAYELIQNGDIEGARGLLKNAGFSEKTIAQQISTIVSQEAYNMYVRNGDVSALREFLSGCEGMSENDCKKIVSQALYNHIAGLGYGDLIDTNPEFFDGMLNCLLEGNSLVDYSRLNANDFEVIDYITRQMNSGMIDEQTLQAISIRKNSPLYMTYELFKYADNIELIPPEGIDGIPREECIEAIISQILPIRNCLAQQSIPADIQVTRCDTSQVLNYIEYNGGNLADILNSGDSEAISRALQYLNTGNATYSSDCFTGTTLWDGSYRTGNGVSLMVQWVIDVPEGSQGMYLEGLVSNNKYYREGEFLLQMGSSFNITSAEMNDGILVLRASYTQ